MDKKLIVCFTIFANLISFSAKGHLAMEQNRVEDIIKSEWSKLNTSWTYKMTPPFPLAWPVPLKSQITIYAYAASGEKISLPWGKVEYTLGKIEDLHFTRLNSDKEIAAIGSQSETPFKKMPEFYSNLKILSEEHEIPRHMDEKTKAQYCLWFKQNAVMTDVLKKDFIRDFYRSLDCK
jgi:hypothetical protein